METAQRSENCPLYVNMAARVTERIGRKLNIQKRAPCKVVGWDLHPADRVSSDEAQRALQYLPRCIYVKFEGESWQIHPRLQPGVFPLRLLKRVWMLNSSTHSKVTRRGVMLPPGYACAAHIVQGGTSDAEMTDSGDYFEVPPCKEVLAAYVWLSRVRTADALLVLRAFSPYLFRHGPPPGPHCLMKLLRARLQRHKELSTHWPKQSRRSKSSKQSRTSEDTKTKRQAGSGGASTVAAPLLQKHSEYFRRTAERPFFVTCHLAIG